MKHFVTSDTHFYHYNVISYCDRPFLTVEEMNKRLIEDWNSVVGKEDTVYFLGDFSFGSIEMMREVLEQLNGYIVFILGNHDRSERVYKEAGIKEVYKSLVIPKEKFGTKLDVVLTHRPISCDFYNIHGHIHNTPLDTTFDPDTHYNASSDIHNYQPIDIETVFAEKNWYPFLKNTFQTV
jgi:calcineurin-like phosphoesterase family protein